MSDSAPTPIDAAFFDLALDLLCVAGLDGYFKKVNPSFERTLGYTSAELLSCAFIDFVHPDDREPTLRELKRLVSGEDMVHFENRYRCKDGSWRWLAWTCPAPQDGQHLLYAVARDMTEQKDAEEQLRIRDSILSSMENGLLITDPTKPDNPIIYCNPAFCRLTGYTPKEILGHNCRFLQGDDRIQPQRDVLREAISEGRACRVLLRNYRKDGSLFWNELIISPVRDRRNQLTHFVGLQYDISNIVHANAERWREVSERLETLAPRQRQVLDLLVAGQNTKSIARQLGISPKTVEIHRARVFEKMSVESTVNLVRLLVGSQR